MLHKSVRYISLLLFLFCVGKPGLHAQTITADDSTGCAPMAVKFTGISGATNITWDFGDGTNPVSDPDPTHPFTSPGTYVVNYTATVNGSTVNESITINVFGNPTPSFTATTPVKGCINLPVTFDASASAGGGGTAIVNYQWDFGDGGIYTSNTSTPTYTFTLEGTFDVNLIVTDANGCDSTLTMQDMVSTSDKPKPVITSTPTPPAACSPPLDVLFSASSSTSSSPTSSTLTYEWDFGNGNTSTLENPPQQTYSDTGSYTVTLTVADDNTCDSSITTTVTIANPFASFTVPDDTLCANIPITFDPSASTGYTSLKWLYGDSQSGSSPKNTYIAGGTYDVKLTASSGTCSDDTTITIYIEEVKAEFTTDSTYTCSLPQLVTFDNQSTTSDPNNQGLSGFTYEWTFSTGSVLYGVTPEDTTNFEPAVTIFHMDTNRYTINKEDYILNATLTITSPHGCTDSETKNPLDTIYLPTARLQPDTSQGCFPLTVTFSDSSRSKEDILTYEYIFGDGTPNVTMNDTTPVVHTYGTPGIYEATLVITNTRGCTDTSYAVLIHVGAPPDPDFTVSPTNACINTPVQFTDASTPTGSPIDTWHYKTDNGFMMSSCFNDPNPEWSFVNGTGAQDVTLIACSRGCCDSLTKTSAVTINGPWAEFKVKMDCNAPFDYTFEGNLKDADSWTWEFGDGNIDNSNDTVVSHTYAATGDYVAKLIAFNSTSGCPSDTFIVNVYVRDIKAAFTVSDPDSIFCTNDPQTFDAAPSEGEYVFTKNGYVWLWGDNTPPTITNQVTATHSFTSAGPDTVILVVTDINGCRDTATMIVTLSEVTAEFVTDSIFGCIPWTVTFKDTSRSDTTITEWFWDFGDDSTFTATDSLPFDYTYTDNNTQSFVATLTATNVIGCSDNFSKTLTPSKPNASFFFTNNRCAGDQVAFNPVFDNHKEYLFKFGDGKDTNVIAPYPSPFTGVVNHAYDSAGIGFYLVTLVVTDSIGCIDSTTQNINIQDYPKVIIWASSDTATTMCSGYKPIFRDSSIVNVFKSRMWDFDNGSPVVSALDVTTQYNAPGIYNVSLIVETTYGCVDTGYKQVKVDGPLADFDLSPSTPICIGESVTFNLKDTADVFTWHWFFEGGSDTTAVSPVTHTFDSYPQNGLANVTLFYWSSDSTCKQFLTKTVAIHPVVADFIRNTVDTLPTDTSHCLGVKDVFTNASTNADTWQWDFGDGTTSANTPAPEHEYTTPGTYTVTLSILDDPATGTGCVDTMRKEMVVYAAPTVNATGGDTCQGAPLQLSATGGVTYAWSPAEDIDTTGTATPIATPDESTTYTVTVTDANGCTGSDTAQVNIIQPPHEINFTDSIIIGDSITLPYTITPVENYIFSWTPADSVFCPTCPSTITRPFVNNNYILTVSDIFGCFSRESEYYIEVLPKSSIDVPSAFTPNGDGENDIVYVKGWAIKNLIEFNIYNRWGELVFSTNNINQGWDGTYKGVPQNMDTYAYIVKAETYVSVDPKTQRGHMDTDESRVKMIKGYIKLLR